MRKRGTNPRFYEYVGVPGSKNISEQKSFLSSTLLSLPNKIAIRDSIITYSDNDLGEQNNINETTKIYDINVDKQENTLVIYDNNKTFNLRVMLYSIISEYIFAKLKSSRCFGNITSQDSSGDINSDIFKIIKNNILNLYRIEYIKVYTKEVPINNTYMHPRLDASIVDNYTKKSIYFNMSEIEKILNINVKIDNDPSKYTLLYYYDIYLVKKT